MKKLIARLSIPLIASLIIFASCSDQKTTTEEKVEISTMDSTEKAAKEAAEKLEEQTKKVEASIEEMDKEFETKN
jgi:ABC-type glycerol-3-phosphate transport system substrate-binding protein